MYIVIFLSCAMALLDLKAILTIVCLNWLVILRMCGEEKVKVAQFGQFSVILGVWWALFCVVFGVLVCEGSLVYALVQCRRVFQSLRCIRPLRLSTKRHQCIQ